MSKLTDALRQEHVLISHSGVSLYLLCQGDYTRNTRSAIRCVHRRGGVGKLRETTAFLHEFEGLLIADRFCRIDEPKTVEDHKFVYDAKILLGS